MNPKDEDPRAKIVARANAGLMDIESEEHLKALLQLNPRELSPEDRGFMYGRRTYMNDEQKRIFASVLEAEEEKSKAYMKSLGGNSPEEEDKPEVGYRELQKQATELGIHAVGVSREDLEKAVAEKVA